jgi:two-component system phosphate regulon sensor histidine kinase PhoR
MFKRRLKNPIFLIYLLSFYIVLQFGWWLYLIFDLYSETYTQTEILTKKIWMLVGEGTVFLFILVLGLLAIRRAFKKEQAFNKFQENFLLSVTHELKTPISSVKLFLQTLKKRTLPPEQMQQIYSQSLDEMNRLDNLVNNILVTHSIENNNYFLDKKDLDIAEFIANKITILENTILKSYRVYLDLKPVHLSVDKNAFESILINLLENAAKYSPLNSQISVSCSNDEQYVYVTISDEGCGIDTSKKHAVFSKFFREENEMTRKSKGTGLGLFITNFLVNAHNGIIRITDNKPTGTIVHLKFKRS